MEEALKRKLISMLAEASSEGEESCSSRSESPLPPPPPPPPFHTSASDSTASPAFMVTERALQLGADDLASLHRDARLAFALGSSNWLDATATPRCSFERIALAVFEARTREVEFKRDRAGVEWWAQVRREGHAEEAIQLHWDVDEVGLVRFPPWSTACLL